MPNRLHAPLDLQQVLDAAPGLFLALAPDSPRFTVLAATDAFLRASRTQRSEIIGRSYFDIFPEHCDATEARTLQGTRASLTRAMSARMPDTLAPQQRGIGRLPVEGRSSEKRLWREINSPVIDANGELVCLIHSIEDMSEQACGEIGHILITPESMTPRLQTAHALRESEQRYRSLFTAIDQACCIIELIFDGHESSPDFRFLEVNPAFESKTGLQAATGKRARELLPELRGDWIDHFAQVARTGEPRRFVGEIQTGGQRWFDVYAFPFGGSAGSKVAIVFSAITERLRKESNLAFLVELEQTLAGINFSAELLRVASKRIAGYLQLRHCMLTEIDQAAGHATVLHEHLAEGAPALARIRPLTELRTEVQRQALASGQTLVSFDVLTEGRGAVELRRLAARGVRSQVSAPYVVDGHWKFLLTALRGQTYDWPPDEVELITELATRVYIHLQRARAQEQLVESEQRLRLAADAAHFGMYDRDLGGGHFHVSTQFKQMLGYEPGATLGRLQVLSHMHPDDRVAGQAAFGRACDPAGDGQIALEQRIVRHDGTVRWISSVGRVLFEDGEPRRSIGFWVDITERKQLERETLEQTRALAEQDRRKDEFLAMLGHELRNPLAALASAVQLLGLQGNGDAAQQPVSAIIGRQVGQLKHLVDDLLEVSRISTGRVQLRRTSLDLCAVVERAVESTGPMIAQHAHELTVSMPAEPVWLHADAARLEQVLVNLLNNAAKYTADGGRICLSVNQQVDAQPPTAVISVSDSGIGIAPELLPQVFDLFTQADQSLHRSQGGLGIGLALVRRLIELHGGTVAASSVPGQGSEFVVRLPLWVRTAEDLLVEAGATVPAALDSPVPSAVSGRRVLLVDDNVDAAQTLGVLLEMNGHSVHLAYDGPTAIEAAIQCRPEVVLLDIGLPGLDGYQTAQRIRQQAGLAGIVLIALTGYGLESDRQRSQQAGFDRHLVKPASLDEIEQALRPVADDKPPC